ncbi:hypothetical protein [Actinomycetospora sp. OC33-EN07]|uniref:Uncharacterized protein n=2 Tax=Actinomycetospora flava TaxID=3129232 RepID=A0ABU8MFG1_9PSEU
MATTVQDAIDARGVERPPTEATIPAGYEAGSLNRPRAPATARRWSLSGVKFRFSGGRRRATTAPSTEAASTATDHVRERWRRIQAVSSRRWSESSVVPRTAALENRARYVPAFGTPLPGMETMGQDPDVLGHAMVVYRGDLASGRTAGWLAVPSLDEAGRESCHPWMAAALLWRDEGDVGGRGTRPAEGDSTLPTRFDARPTVIAPVTLRPTSRPSAS